MTSGYGAKPFSAILKDYLWELFSGDEVLSTLGLDIRYLERDYEEGELSYPVLGIAMVSPFESRPGVDGSVWDAVGVVSIRCIYQTTLDSDPLEAFQRVNELLEDLHDVEHQGVYLTFSWKRENQPNSSNYPIAFREHGAQYRVIAQAT